MLTRLLTGLSVLALLGTAACGGRSVDDGGQRGAVEFNQVR
jgi:hypothetical protein